MGQVDRVLLCTCDRTMTVDGDGIAKALGGVDTRTVNGLCTSDLDIAAGALGTEGTTLIACGQMAAIFEDLAEELDAAPRLATVDIRDRAGWTADGAATAKQAALLKEALLPRPATPVKDVVSEGVCLILGRADDVLPAARDLATTHAVTALLTDIPDDLIPTGDFDIALGRVKMATGALGAFDITVDGFAPMAPAGRGAAQFLPPKDGAKSTCDIVLDLRGDGPLFPADHKREGYLRADPGRPAEVARVVAEAGQLQGVFEKPLYIRFDPSICAHSRASQSGCDRCLSVCPTGAITPAGDTVAIDPDVCAGCGACAVVCPSGAASFDDPPVETLFARLRTLSAAFRDAGGTAPRALFVEETGSEMIRLSARFGRGLPADVIPVEVSNVEGVGHAEMLAALGVGFAHAAILPGPRTDRTVPERELALARAIAGTDASLAVLDAADPDALEDALYEGTAPAPLAQSILPVGGRRDVTRLAATAINPSEAPIPLPAGAPYGAVVIDPDACTLCLACVSLCPVGALGDNPDAPEVRFQEAACLQCGICANTCPETAITLVPRLNTDKEALTHQKLHGEDPFECISCGAPFGVKSTIERIVEKLEGNHWMYKNSDNTKLIQMCDDCRVQAQYHQDASPFNMGNRPAVRTTEDYLKDRDKGDA